MDKIKFLMTDTGAQTTQLCRQALEAKGIDVTVCEKNGSQALKSLLEEHPQAVLLDAFMPDLDAITVKQRYETQDTRGGHTTFFVTGAFQVRKWSRICWITASRSFSLSRLMKTFWSAAY